MNTPLITAGALMLALSFSAIAEDMPGMKMDGMKMDSSQAAAPASAEGTIKAIDGERHSVTLAHGPVASLQWPPMTMGFKATEEQLKGLQVGDTVDFEFLYEGGASKIVSIRKK
ncbi:MULTISPECIES: copper-binding protein [unclassified Pseudomonas]|uniref:copper-binding protein n=1 Tax=unclassified Pseudomonas TaxID=196821 RepID=UPI000730745E|nr:MULTISPECIES: copper-binding protein [unclassified Pseudomonas]KSW24320.1 heat-shock protein HtpX [Pseudomonas sp. ADP]OBP11253.1 heat-shock protein HtpX [Pseudomonas sp. EGD-AKN5]QOF86880.1 copper-binding protein [Pseudomonas sp. ADPe]